MVCAIIIELSSSTFEKTVYILRVCTIIQFPTLTIWTVNFQHYRNVACIYTQESLLATHRKI